MSLAIDTTDIREIAGMLSKAEEALHGDVHQLSGTVTEATSQLNASLNNVVAVGASSLGTETQTLTTRLSDTLAEFETNVKQNLEQAGEERR